SPRGEGWRWLEQAQADLRWARHLNEQGAYYLVCFLAQQAAEKALKAFLYAQGEELVVGHSVRQLCKRAAEYDTRFRHYLNDWGVLDSYYIPTRYPNGLPDDIPARVYNLQAAEGALTLAEAVVAEIESWFAATGTKGEAPGGGVG
ncbi:MAG: HEPN domain-containing protein, partial [Chloroflexi bacterium]